MPAPLPPTVAWWIALVIQLVALPGVLLPVLPGLVLLPLGAGLWCWSVGWSQGWPALAAALLVLALGWGADALGLVLGPARLRASRWSYIGAGVGLLLGILGLLPALPVGGPLLGALLGPLLGAAAGELLAELVASRRGGLALLRRSALVGLAVVSGMLVSKLAQALLALCGAAGFVVLSLWGPAAAP